MMTSRERFKAVINFKKPDRLPWVEVFYDEVLLKWFTEGLPANELTVIEWEMGRGGSLLQNWPVVKGFDPNSYFGCQSLFSCIVPVDIGPIPRFKQRVLRRDARYIDYLAETGVTLRRLRQGEYVWYNMPMFIDFPVKNRESWEAYKRRLDPKDARRYPKDWDAEAYLDFFEGYQKGNTLLRFNGFYGFGAQLMGIPTFTVMFYQDPDLIHDMAEYWAYFIMETIKDAVETLKDRIDMVFWWEDLAEKHGPCISPRIYKTFLLPHYQKVTSFLRKNKIDRIMMDSDGNINPLLDLIVDAGITGIWPLEVSSNMDAASISKKYGTKLFLGGNLDKRELAKGGGAMKSEVDSKVPLLKELGGYFPEVDHLVHADFSLQKFKEYTAYLKTQL
ncbi:MAG: uroporphyrinogen decarboxylase family protein [Candidatus Ranarchaeia archaeon]|jgi:uroporphyrinogen decarboxylase